MSLTVKTEKEVLKVYDTWLHSYLNGDVPTYNSFLDDAFHFIGSTSSEEFLNRKDTTNFFYATAEQLSGKTDLRNETKIVEQFGEVVFITHLFDAWFLAGADWSFYGRFRCTNALQKNQDGWRFIYQHYSTPDSKAQEGETIGFDQVTAENLQLREAIQRRTKELEEKNRELEIEGALERIRAKAVAMKDSSDLLDIVVSMRTEFIKLGHEAHYFWHMMWLPETYEKAMTSGDGTKIGFVMQLPRHIHGDIPLLAKWEKSDAPIVVYPMDTEAAIDYVDKMVALGNFQNIDPQAPSQNDIRNIGGLTFIMARTTHGEIGYSLPGVVENPPKEDLAILEKFASAFDLAHRRFLDLQKAEKQAREVQIELALEKVRSRTMAMQKSEELKEVIEVVYDQFIQLSIPIEHTGFILDYKENEDMHIWLADQNAVFPQIVLPYFDCAHWNSFKEAKDKGTHFFTNQLDFEEKNKFYKDLFQFIPELPEEVKEHYFTCPALAISTVLLDNVGLYIENYTGTPFSEEENQILMRFGKVFQQTYTRFLDLQRAEAQAREARIEAALERIRSQSMGMQTTNDLSKVTTEMFNQLRQFGGELFATGIVFCEKHKDHVEQWHSIPNAGMMSPFIVPIHLDYIHQYRYDQWKKGAELFSIEIPGDFIEQHFNDIFNLPSAQKVLKDLKDKKTPMPEAPPWEIDYGASFKYGYVLVSSLEHFKEAEILPRFAKVFEQTYTRFLDLQNAEEQARGAQIEMALEKVRSRTMAMQHSDELPEAANVLFTEVQKLGIAAWSCGYNILSEDKKSSTCIMSSEGEIQSPFILPLTEHKSLKPWHKAILNNEDFFVYEQGGKDLEAHYEYMLGLPELQETFLQFKDADIPLPTFQVNHLAKFTNGFLLFITYERVPEAHDIFKRFASVFEQTYTRFLDLQKAEAQAREAQIEAALERTRTQSMLMQHSSELDATSKIFHEQLQLLGIATEFSYVWLPDEAKNEHKFWVAWNVEKKDDTIIKSKAIVYPMDKTEPYTANCFKDWASGEPVHIHHIKPKEVATFFSAWEELLKDAKKLNPAYFSEGLFYAEAFMKYGCFGINIKRSITEEEKQILQRFSIEFERTYTRFLDLKKAEQQAREAQIEAALEKVRSRSLAMHATDELQEVVAVVAQKLKDLGVIYDAGGVILCTYFPANKDVMHWIAADDFSYSGNYLVPYFENPIFDDAWESKIRGDEFFSKDFSTEDKNSFFKYAFEHSDYKHFPDEFKKHALQAEQHRLTAAWSKNSAILIPSFTGAMPSDSDAEIMKRFAKVFEQAYIRFLDLQKAEAQSKEAKIEASLEKVRTVALSLKNSDDMLDIAQVLYEQLLELGFTDMRNAIIDIHNDETETFLDYDYSHDMSSAITEFSYYGDPVIEQQIKKTQSGHDAFFEIELKGEQLNELIETRIRNGEKDDPRLHEIDHLTYNLYSFGNGAIGISNFGILSEEQKKVLKRFRNVFTFAYKRYTDLANAEAQAREAKIEAALEKVRSVALSMNQSTDLLHIAKALYEQLVELGFSDIRNALIDVNNEDDKTFLDYDYSDEMGGTITLMSYDDDPTLVEQVKDIAATTDGFSEMVLEGQQLQDLIEMRRNNGEADDPRLLKTDSIAYILYAFGNGAVGISNFGLLNKDQKSILDRFRNVFTFAYQRFKDLQVREEQSAKLLDEKIRLEKTLTDLQETQKQLIQSEKMASLGELTAGIAHEIQNPLNFVNNFSEVSNELIGEIDEELAKGDMDEVKALLIDIKQNLTKITHHGKRADAIVKGMLQHSRKSNAEKEPTNINKLADEYLRLAYHGLRAKDKSFNAALETDFDETIGLVNVIPQDMGRVILNLITNAFYTTNERKKESKDSDFKPTVSVITKKIKNSVEILVQDNGNGIPKHAVDKIFQPFFTTKPTGEGTGLGLSMSYDIVKAHGGDLTVATKINEGTKFTIVLPISNQIE